MAFNPSSTITLCSVPIDSTYKNQIYFSSAAQQYAYFAGKAVMRFADYLTVRETLPDGTFQSSVKVNANIDDLRMCNYMFYQNANHGARFFYAFIKKLVYIAEKTTKIIFETDVYQTWLFDVKLLDSYVEREHSETDGYGENTVPEKFNCVDFTYKNVGDIQGLEAWGYLVGSSDPRPSHEDEKGKLMTGIYQGLYFYYFFSVESLNAFIDEMDAIGKECIQFITCIPVSVVADSFVSAGGGLLESSEAASILQTTFSNIYNGVIGKGYNPKNKKLFNFPYLSLIVTNHSGNEAEYQIEDFADPDNISFELVGDISASPSVAAIPLNYKGLAKAYEQGIAISGFPQCSFNNDTYKLWLAKNQFGNAINVGQGALSIVGGIGSALFGNPLGLTMAASGVSSILGTINEGVKASKEPNKVSNGNSNCNLLTAIKQNTLSVQLRMIKPNYMQTLDDFFTMYGYQTNKVKKPNVSKRPYFNYVKTVDINIAGGIPSDDMEKLKAMYNNGVTLWKSNATVGDYSVNNKP